MAAKKPPISKIKSDPNLSASRSEKLSAAVLTRPLDAELPMQQIKSIHGDFAVICNASEPNLTAPSLRPSMLPSMPAERRTPLIRFQSRVRIVSGIVRHRQKSSDISPRSSPSSSRASSVYAPLRSRSDNGGSSREMGQRVSKLTRGRRRLGENGKRIKKQCGLECATLRESKELNHMMDERTPLIKRTIQSTFEREGMDINDYESDEGAHLSRAEDFNFGTWPARLLNRYWWWWRMEPVLCCHCLDESDTEY